MGKVIKKTILIDAKVLLSPFTGIARYTYENSKRIKQSDDYNVYFNYIYPSKNLLENRNQKTKSKFTINLLSKNRFLKKYKRKLINAINIFDHKIYDIYWQPNIIPNPHIKAKNIVSTVHDLSFLHYPKSHPKERIDYFKKNFVKQVSKSSYIITGSNYTKEEIVKYLHFSPNKVRVISHGIDHNLYKKYPNNILNKTKQKFNLPDNFLLFVGSIEPRKNLLTLLKAFNSLQEEIKQKYPLFLVGASGWKNEDILQEINQSPHINYIGYIKDEELPHIYNLATVFIYPSLYEGFGIPPLEAMACATPTIVSNTTAMPEICQDATLYINPADTSDIKDKILLLLRNENLQRELIEKGLQRVKKFTWEKSAQKHIELFDYLG